MLYGFIDKKKKIMIYKIFCVPISDTDLFFSVRTVQKLQICNLKHSGTALKRISETLIIH